MTNGEIPLAPFRSAIQNTRPLFFVSAQTNQAPLGEQPSVSSALVPYESSDSNALDIDEMDFEIAPDYRPYVHHVPPPPSLLPRTGNIGIGVNRNSYGVPPEVRLRPAHPDQPVPYDWSTIKWPNDLEPPPHVLESLEALMVYTTITPGQCLELGSYPLCVIHVNPTAFKYGYIDWKIGHNNSVVFHKGCFPLERAPTFVMYVTKLRCHIYRYSGNRKRNLSVAIPEALLLCERATTRAEILALLHMAGIEQNPGWDPAPLIIGSAVNLTFYLSTGRSPIFIEAVYLGVGAFLVTFVYSLHRQNQLVPLVNHVLPLAASYLHGIAHSVANKLMHILNGNTTEAERRKLNRCAFQFEASNSLSWKFDEIDCYRFLEARTSHPFVKEHPLPWLVEKLLMRRGVRIHDAFRMICERYRVLPDSLPPLTLPSPSRELPPVAPDVNHITSSKVINGDALTSRDRRSLARVTKQSGVFSMPTFGLSTLAESVSSSSVNVKDGLEAHGVHISSGLHDTANSLRSGLSEAASTIKNTASSITTSVDNAGNKIETSLNSLLTNLKSIDVRHSFSLKQPIQTTQDIASVAGTIPSQLQLFFDLLSDTLPWLISDDPLVALASQPALIRRYGFLTTALVDSLILFMKKFKKWFVSDVTKQVHTEIVNESVLSMFYAIIYALIFNTLPDGYGGSLKDRLHTFNSAFTFTKNVSSAASFFVNMFKYCVDWIYEIITGHPYFDQEEKDALFEASIISSQIEHLLSLPTLTPDNLDDMTRLRRTSANVHAKMLLYPRLEKSALTFKKLAAALNAYHSEVALDVEMTSGKPRTTLVRFVGTGGIGKTTLVDMICAALHGLCQWPGNYRSCQSQFDYDFNFQSGLTPEMKVLVIDDPFVVQNDQVIASVIRDLYAQGNSRPKKREGASLETKETMYERFEAAIVTDMGARSDIPNNSDQGLGRRFNGGQYDTTVNDPFKAGTQLDANKVTLDNADDVWTFESRSDGQKYKFWDIVYIMYGQILYSRQIYDKMQTDLSALRLKAINQPIRKVDPPATSTSFARRHDSDQTSTKPFSSSAPTPNVSVRDALRLANAVKGVTKQVHATPDVLDEICTATGLSRTKVEALLASIPGDVDLTTLSPTELNNEFGTNIEVKSPAAYIINYIDKFVIEKGKAPEKAKKQVYELDDQELLKTVVVRKECVWLDGQCVQHGRPCASRIEAPEVKSPWWIRQQLARVPKLKFPEWMTHCYDKLCSYGWIVPDVPTVLKSIVSYLAAPVIVAALGFLLSSALSLFFSPAIVPQAYSTTYARVPRKGGQVLPGAVTKQVNLNSTRPSNDAWLEEKIANNTIPIAVPCIPVGSNMVKHSSANLFCVESNIHFCVKHILIDDPLLGKIALFGDVAMSYPLREVAFKGWNEPLTEIDDSKSIVWFVRIPGVDLCMVITPRSGMIRPSLEKFLAPAGTPINSLTGVRTVLRPSHVNEVDDDYRVTKSKCIASYTHPIGDVVALDSYQIEDSPLGLFARCPDRTPDGSCSSAWFTTNTRVGEGHARIVAIQAAYIESQLLAVGVPISREFYHQCKSLLPERKFNLTASLKDTFPPNSGEIAANVVPVSTLPKKQGATQNLRNTIKRSPAHGVLTGLEIYHPVEKKTVLIPPPSRIPVDLRDPVRALQKMPLSRTPWTDQMIEDYREAATYVGNRITSKLDQKFVDGLYLPTLRQVINGDPDKSIPEIDMKKSAGWFPGNSLPGKEVYFYKCSPSEWDLKPEWVPEFLEILQDFREGRIPTAIVVDNGKMELRPPPKCPRNTSAYQALVLTAVKYILYWYPAAMKYGRIANQTLYGTDLNSTDGAAVKLKLDRHPHGNQGDYNNFDATIGPEQGQVVAEDSILPTMQFIRSHGGTDFSDIAILAAIRTQTLVLHIFGTVVYVRWFGNTSGGFLTTPFNCNIGATNYAYAWLKHHREKGYTQPVWEMYERNNTLFVYGDDYDATTSDESFDNIKIAASVKELEQLVTPAAKGTQFTPHVYRNNILKRYPVVRNHRVHWVLDLEVLCEIHAFIRDSSVSLMEATMTNMDSALREWYHYDRNAFEIVKRAFNDMLTLRNHPNLLLSFTDLDRDFNAGYGSYAAYGTVKKQSSTCVLRTLSSRLVTRTGSAQPVNCFPVRVIAAQAVFATPPPIFRAFAPAWSYKRAAATPSISNQDASTSTTAAAAPRVDDSPITGTTALTSYDDDTAVTTVTPPTAVIAPRTDPYPDQGMREVLSRQYRVADVSWTGAAQGTLLYSAKFPETLFAIPNIQDKLKSSRYFRGGAKVSFRVNANAFAGGTLMIGYIPFYNPAAPGAWRHMFYQLAQSGVHLLSASRADTVEITIPWIAPFQYRDLRSSDNMGMIGTIFVYVLNPLVFSNTGAPSSLSLSVFASFIDPQVAGPDVNGAPASALTVTKQSGEALMKSVKGVIAGVKQATSTVAGIVGPFKDLLPLTFLDKPSSLAANAPMSLVPARGMVHGKGLDLSTKLSLDPEAQVSVDDSVFGGSKSRPTWAEVLGNPGLILVTSFTQAAAADTLIASWPVRPNYCKKVGTTYHPSSLAYYSMFFRYWRGSIKYMIHFACPSNVTARVRISFLPNVLATSAPPENQAGDVISKVLSITGDTCIVFPIEYLADTYMKECSNLAVADSDNLDSVGRVTISVLNEVVSVNTAAVTPVGVSVWMGAGPNFVFSMPDDFPSEWSYNTSPSVTKQSSVRELFAQPAPGLVETTLLQEKGIVTPEPFTGPLDLLHRFIFVFNSLDTEVGPAGPYQLTVPWYLLLPFLGWRGAWRSKLVPRDNALNKFFYVRWVGDDPAGAGMLSGVQFFQTSSIAEVEFPYYDIYSWRETDPIMDVLPRPDWVIRSESDTASYNQFDAVGDDFSLGPLLGPPSLTYVAPAARRSPSID